MADDVVKRLLIKLGIDRTDWDNATKEIKRTMDSLYQAERAKSAQRKQDAQADVQNMQAQLAAQRQLKEATDAHLQKLSDAAKIRGKALDQMKEEVAEERVRLDAKSQVLRVMAQQGQLQSAALRNLQQEVSLERSNLAIKQAQLRAAITAQSSERRQGFAGGLLEGFSSRLAGTIGFSVLSAEGLGRIFEMAYEKVKELGRALLEATGPAQTLRKEFEYLATSKGIAPDTLLEKMRTATRNLVSDEQLLKTGTQFLRSEAKITSTQFETLTDNVTKLARASGHDVGAALDALGRTMQTGRGYTLAYALGLTNVRELMVQGIPAGASEATRATLGLNQVMNALAKEASKVVVPAATLPELFQQMKVQSENFIDGIAQGLTHTQSFKDSIASLSDKLRDMQPRLEQMAKQFGEKLANAIKFVTDHLTEIKVAFLALIGVRIADWVIMNSDRWTAWGNTIGWVAKQLGLVKKAEEELIAVQATEKIIGGSQPSLLGTAATTVEGGIPGISPGIAKLLSTGKGGLAYGARSAQLAGAASQTAAATEGDLFAGLGGLGELGVINVGADATGAGAGLGTGLTGAGALAGGGALATAGLVAAAIAAAGAVTAALMVKNKATLRDMLDGVKELASEIISSLKGAWDVVIEYARPKWDAAINYVKLGFKQISIWASELNNSSKASTGKTIWDQILEGIANISPYTMVLDKLIGQLKALAEFGRSKQYMEGAMAAGRHVGVTGPAADEEARTEKNRAAALARQSSVKDMNLTLDRELAQERLKIAEETAKARFALIKEELDNEEAALKQKYEIGLMDLSHYIDQEKILRKRELDNRLAEIEADRRARVAQIRGNAKTVQTGPDGKQSYQLEDPSLTNAKIQAVNVQAREQSIQAEAQYQKQLAELLYQRLQDEMAAQKTYEEEVLKLRKSAIDAQTKYLEDHFKGGEVSADAYLQKRKELIIQERDAVLAELQQEMQDSKQTDAEKAKFTVQMVEARMAAEKQLAQLESEQDQIRLQAAENRYKRELQFNTAMQQMAQFGIQTGKPGASEQNVALLQQAMSMDEQQLRLLTDMLGKTEEGSAEWYKIVQDIGEVNARLTETNKKLAEAKDFATPLANIFDQIAKAIGGADSKTAKWLATLSQSMKEMAQWSKQMQEQGGGMSALHSLGSSFTNLFRKVPVNVPKPPKTAQEMADESTKKFSRDADTAAQTLEGLAKSSKATATSLQSDWQKAIDTLNSDLKSAADSMSSKFQPLIDAANRAADALNRVAGSSGGQNSSQGQTPISVTPESTTVGGLAPTSGGDSSAPTSSSGVFGTVPGTSGGELPAQASTLSSIFKDLGQNAGNVSKGFAGFTEKLGTFLNKLGGFAQGISSFIQGISQAKTTGQGVVSGLMGGAQVGMQLGGPIGAAIGAGVGATIGGLVGHKEAIAQAQAEAIKTKLEQIKDSLANNTITLGQAISQLQGLRSAVTTEMRASGKKGNKAGLPQELQAINDQINQLLEEQKKILTDLSTQLAILLEPKPYQDVLTSLSEIIQKYQEFASAASGNTAAMTEANQWLVASLQAYATTMANNVRSANEQAISDAEKLIDLQNELNNEQLQEYDILTRGVMGRQRSQAQQKGMEIEQVEQQKQQTQSEYDLQKYKVDAESKMFNLAQDRLGLEQQMVQLQEQDFDLWSQQVTAMQKVLAQLQGALGPGGTLPAGLLNATGGVDIQSLEQLLGLPVTATGPAGVGQPYIQNEPAIFSEFVDIIDQNTSFKNFGADLLAAAATPFGSAQRQALVGDLSANNYEIGHALINAGAIQKPVHGKDYDPNWLNFFDWIANQAVAITPGSAQGTVPTPTLPAIPGFETGGYVDSEGPAYLHAGEFVLPAPVVNYIKTAMSNMRTSLQGFEGTVANKPSVWGGSPIVQGPISPLGGLLDTHQQIYDLTSTRVGMEHDLISAQRQQAMLEMDRMGQMSDLLNQMYNFKGAGVTSMEGAFAKVYELRGRYGSAGFRRETL